MFVPNEYFYIVSKFLRLLLLEHNPYRRVTEFASRANFLRKYLC